VPRQTTATLIAGPTKPDDFYGNPLYAHHLLSLTENFRATWSVHSLRDPDSSVAYFDADSPVRLLAQGMLAFLSHALSDVLAEADDLAALITVDSVGRSTTRTPDPVAAGAIYALFGQWAQGALTLLEGTALRPAEVAAAVAGGVTLQASDARWQHRDMHLLQPERLEQHTAGGKP
jgi:hypothetical protein